MHVNQAQDENTRKAKQVFDFYRGKFMGRVCGKKSNNL